MTNTIEIIEKKISEKKWEVFNKLHKIIMSDNKKIYFCFFTIYVKYFLDDKVIAIVFFRNNLLDEDSIDLGLKFNKKPTIKGLRDAKYMKDPGANYSMIINAKNFDKNKIKEVIKLSQKQ